MITKTNTQEKAEHLWASPQVKDFICANGFVDITKNIDSEQIQKNKGYEVGDTKEWFRLPGTREPLIKFDYINIQFYPDSDLRGTITLDILRGVIAFAKLPISARRNIEKNSIRGFSDLPDIIEDMETNECGVYRRASHRKFKETWDSVIIP